MKPRTLTWIAAAVFAVSYLLPAYDSQRGYQCFLWCWNMLLSLGDESRDPLFLRLYYPAFVPTNLLFIAVTASGLASPRFFGTRFFLCAVAFFHVLSWLILNVNKDSFAAIMPGYYAWFASYGLLLAALLLENKRTAA